MEQNEVTGKELLDGEKDDRPVQDKLSELDFEGFSDTDDTVIGTYL